MERVQAAGAFTGADVFRASKEAEAAFDKGNYTLLTAENLAWIERHMAAGDILIDIGLDVNRQDRGKGYELETTWTIGYPRIRLPWPGRRGPSPKP